ncbi:MAG: hypothetical protein BWX86_02218 [Verrucomicrobia bacterium ADurb.Bin122]|nr:MAG: hypothetical protein BWX86_02218 [Verrucomicrobia bacterium ADurb.Bin122]
MLTSGSPSSEARDAYRFDVLQRLAWSNFRRRSAFSAAHRGTNKLTTMKRMIETVSTTAGESPSSSMGRPPVIVNQMSQPMNTREVALAKSTQRRVSRLISAGTCGEETVRKMTKSPARPMSALARIGPSARPAPVVAAVVPEPPVAVAALAVPAPAIEIPTPTAIGGRAPSTPAVKTLPGRVRTNTPSMRRASSSRNSNRPRLSRWRMTSSESSSALATSATDCCSR